MKKTRKKTKQKEKSSFFKNFVIKIMSKTEEKLTDKISDYIVLFLTNIFKYIIGLISLNYVIRMAIHILDVNVCIEILVK